MSDLRVRDLATECEVQALRAENARLRADLRAALAALVEQAQIAEEAGLVLKGVCRTDRAIAEELARTLNDPVSAFPRGGGS